MSLFEALIVSIYLCMNFSPGMKDIPGQYCVTPVKCPEGHGYHPKYCIRDFWK